MNKKSQARALYIRALCAVLVKLTTQDIEKRMRAEHTNLGMHSFIVLRSLRHKSFTAKELSKQLFVSPATLIPMIDVLEEKGLVTRGSDKEDRRKTPLALTKKGSALVDRVPLLDSQNKLIQVIENVGQEKTERVINLLEELVALLSEDEKIGDRMRGFVERETKESIK